MSELLKGASVMVWKFMLTNETNGKGAYVVARRYTGNEWPGRGMRGGIGGRQEQGEVEKAHR